MEALRKLAGERKLLMVGDSKLVSYPNLSAMVAARVSFIAPASKTYVDQATLAEKDVEAATPVDYVAERDEAKAPEDRGRFRVSEDVMALGGKAKAKADPILRLRRVFVWSSARSGAAEVARAKKLGRARDDLARLERGLGGRHYPSAKSVEERVTGDHHEIACIALRRLAAGIEGLDVGGGRLGQALHLALAQLLARCPADRANRVVEGSPRRLDSRQAAQAVGLALGREVELGIGRVQAFPAGAPISDAGHRHLAQDRLQVSAV